MRKVLFLTLFILIFISLFVSCSDEKESIIGKTGLGGGIIFYDAGDYSNGWRYLEAAPSDLDSVCSYTDAIAKCKDYSTEVNGKVYDDWYLPSAYELNLMYVNLAKEGKGSFKDGQYYWSSDIAPSSDPEDPHAYAIRFVKDYVDIRSNLSQKGLCYVRPMRAY